MITKKKVAAITLGAAVMMPFAGTSAAFAASDSTTANLKPVALSGLTGSGTAMVTVDSNNTLTVTLAAMGRASAHHLRWEVRRPHGPLRRQRGCLRPPNCLNLALKLANSVAFGASSASMGP